MTEALPISSDSVSEGDAFAWIGKVLSNFAIGEQALGKLCLSLDLSVSNGSLTSLADLRARLRGSADRKCHLLDHRISRWSANRPFRHLLAHSTITCLRDGSGCEVIVTRHLPRDRTDVTPDRIWTYEERRELLRQATNDGRSISDHVRDLLNDSARLAALRGSA